MIVRIKNTPPKIGLSNDCRRFLSFAQVVVIILSSLFLLYFMWDLMESCWKHESVHWRIKKFIWIQIKSRFNRSTFVFVFSLCSILFVTVSPNNCFCPRHWQWQFGTVAVFSSWIFFIIYISDMPSIGLNLKILLTIIYRFLTVALIAVLLLLAFGFAFYMVFYDPKLPVSRVYNIYDLEIILGHR